MGWEYPTGGCRTGADTHVSPDSASLLADVIAQLSDCAGASQFWADPTSFPLSPPPSPPPGSFPSSRKLPPLPLPRFPPSPLGVYDRCLGKVLTCQQRLSSP